MLVLVRIVAAAVVAVVVVLLTPDAPQANGAAAMQSVGAKGDRLAVVKGAACAQRAWPNYEPGCLFDKRRPANEVRKISVINIDRRETQPAAPTVNVMASR